MHGSTGPGLGLAGPIQNRVQLLRQNNFAGLSHESPALWKESATCEALINLHYVGDGLEAGVDRAANQCKFLGIEIPQGREVASPAL
jgi:hypothetical protein